MIPGKSEPLEIEIHFFSSTIFFMKGFILSLPEINKQKGIKRLIHPLR